MATIIDWRNIRLHIQNILTVLYVEEGGGMGGGGGWLQGKMLHWVIP